MDSLVACDLNDIFVWRSDGCPGCLLQDEQEEEKSLQWQDYTTAAAYGEYVRIKMNSPSRQLNGIKFLQSTNILYWLLLQES